MTSRAVHALSRTGTRIQAELQGLALLFLAGAIVPAGEPHLVAAPGVTPLLVALALTGLGLWRQHFWARTMAMTLLGGLLVLLALPFGLGGEPGLGARDEAVAAVVLGALLLRLMSVRIRRVFALTALARLRAGTIDPDRRQDRSPST